MMVVENMAIMVARQWLSHRFWKPYLPYHWSEGFLRQMKEEQNHGFYMNVSTIKGAKLERFWQLFTNGTPPRSFGISQVAAWAS